MGLIIKNYESKSGLIIDNDANDWINRWGYEFKVFAGACKA